MKPNVLQINIHSFSSKNFDIHQQHFQRSCSITPPGYNAHLTLSRFLLINQKINVQIEWSCPFPCEIIIKYIGNTSVSCNRSFIHYQVPISLFLHRNEICTYTKNEIASKLTESCLNICMSKSFPFAEQIVRARSFTCIFMATTK